MTKTWNKNEYDFAGQKAIEKWVAPLLKMCDDHLKHILFEKTDPLDKEGEELLFR